MALQTKIGWNKELWHACHQEGNLEFVEKAVANGADVNVSFSFDLVTNLSMYYFHSCD